MTRRLRKKKFFESFEELEGKLKSDRLVKKELMREKTRLEQTATALEKEKVELQEERDAVVEALVKERQHLRDSRIQEVTRERVKVQTAMADKSTRCLGRIWGAPTDITSALMEATKETNPKDDSVLVREEGVENVDPKDHVVVLDSSSEEQDDGDQVKKTEETVEEEGTSADDKGGATSLHD
ncbi:hypothetical protein F2Q70_00034824 [Brassica cretica]|uniref:Uncharacterized protein n=1 Tax=Brassica cretica TaxID=69181 RepID=A0A8S9JZ68_BRACR|nr:hypothetical protein F2Q70_00034824 [Brassica cretica]